MVTGLIGFGAVYIYYSNRIFENPYLELHKNALPENQLYGFSLSFLYQRDKEAVLLWIAGIIPLESLYLVRVN